MAIDAVLAGLWRATLGLAAGARGCAVRRVSCRRPRFLSANLLKFLAGGWFPLVLAAFVFVLMSTWNRGREVMRERLYEGRRAAAPSSPACRGVRRPRARHRGVPDRRSDRRAAGAAAQPQAQQGAARAGRGAEVRNRGRTTGADLGAPADRAHGREFPSRRGALRLHGAAGRDRRADSCQLGPPEPTLMDTSFFLSPRPSCRRHGRTCRAGASRSSSTWRMPRLTPHGTSGCPRTAWSRSAARSRSSDAGPRAASPSAGVLAPQRGTSRSSGARSGFPAAEESLVRFDLGRDRRRLRRHRHEPALHDAEAFGEYGVLPLTEANVLGVLSLIFWSLLPS